MEDNPWINLSQENTCETRTLGVQAVRNHVPADMKPDLLPSDVSLETEVKMWPSAHGPLLSNEDKVGMLLGRLPGCAPLLQLIGNYY